MTFILKLFLNLLRLLIIKCYNYIMKIRICMFLVEIDDKNDSGDFDIVNVIDNTFFSILF